MSTIPESFHTITPYISVKNGDEAIAHYTKAFGARQNGPAMRIPGTDTIMHACLSIGSSNLFLCEASDQFPAPSKGEGAQFYVYVEDMDAVHAQAVEAGMQEILPPTDMFWGDRMSTVQDPYGYIWTLATHQKDVSPEEMEKAMKAMAG